MIPQGFKPPWFNYVEYSESSPSGLVWVKEVGRGGSLKHSGSFAGSISKFGRNLKYWRIGLHNTTYFNHIWEIRDTMLGQFAAIKFFEVGMQGGIHRFHIFKGLRWKEDIS